nr:peptidoglycan-associated lipoprotein Pal [Allosphingosinicella vermicomposti]
MKQIGLKIAVVAAIALTGACAQKPKDLPPPPGGTVVDPNANNGGGDVGNAIIPGSRADFLQKVTSDRVLFELDSYTVDAEDQAILDSQAAWLLANPNVTVTIEGHADERGTREYNLGLGDRRANAAKNYLVSRGVPASRMTTISWGKERPAAVGSDESAWAQNRRAVTVIPQ